MPWFSILRPAVVFLPTPSARRATVFVLTGGGQAAMISTHALREEGDSAQSQSI